MVAQYEGPLDGYAEYTHGEVFETAWQLAAKLPTTFEWANALCWLYEKLPPRAYSMKAPLEVATRWAPDPSDTKRLTKESEDIERGDLGSFARMRKGIARLACRIARTKEARQQILNHEDPAVRAALYFDGELSLEEMKAAGERDLMLSFTEMTWNPRAWRTKERRQLLHDMAWDSRRDPKNYLDPQNTYNATLKTYRAKHPEWFKDEDEQPDPETQPLTSGAFTNGLDDIKGTITHTAELTGAAYQVQLRLLKRTAWIGWGVAAILAALLIRSF
jgi:hypothetical protein